VFSVALYADLVVRGLERVLSVQSPLAPGCLLLGRRFGLGSRGLAGGSSGVGDQSPGVGVLVEEGP
jgi:hypothetical protein